MIQIHDCSRASGKTTKVIKLLNEDKDLYCIIPMNSQRDIYPKELQGRIITGNSNDFDYQFRGRNIKKVIIDECFAYHPRRQLELYYFLGQNQINVIAYGTS